MYGVQFLQLHDDLAKQKLTVVPKLPAILNVAPNHQTAVLLTNQQVPSIRGQKLSVQKLIITLDLCQSSK